MSDIEKARRENSDQRDMTVTQWAAKRNISVPTAHKILNSGHGPETFEIPGIRGRHISPAADVAWEKRMHTLSKTKTARRVAERRKKAAKHAATISAQSPLHISRTGKKASPKIAKQRPKLVAVPPGGAAR